MMNISLWLVISFISKVKSEQSQTKLSLFKSSKVKVDDRLESDNDNNDDDGSGHMYNDQNENDFKSVQFFQHGQEQKEEKQDEQNERQKGTTINTSPLSNISSILNHLYEVAKFDEEFEIDSKHDLHGDHLGQVLETSTGSQNAYFTNVQGS